MDLDGEPAAWCLCDFCIFNPEKAWYRGTSEVDVEDADGVTGKRKGERELGGYGRFANPTFAGENLQTRSIFSRRLSKEGEYRQERYV